MAGRPRKPEMEKLEDAFFDLDVEGQASLLERFTMLHRLKQRQSPSKREGGKQDQKTEPKPAQGVAEMSSQTSG